MNQQKTFEKSLKMKNYILLVTFLLCVKLSAQVEYSLQSLRNVYQSSEYNPAYIPDNTLSIGLPVLSSTKVSISTGFSLSDILSEEKIDGAHRLNVDELLSNFNGKRSVMFVNHEHGLFHIRFKQKNNYWSFHSNLKHDIRVQIPKDMIKFIADGNIGHGAEGLDLGLALDQNLYLENAIGFTKQLDKWTFGGRFKFLVGLTNVRTSEHEIKWTVDEEGIYDWNFALNYDLRVAGLPELDTSGIDNLDEEDIIRDILSFKNTGFGLDLGASYQITDKLQLSAAINDFGFIRWRNNTYSYKLEKDIKTEDFNTFDIDEAIEVIDGTMDIDSLLDIEYTTEEKSYTTSLRTNVNLSARYQLLRKLAFDGVLNISAYRGLRVGGSLGLYWEFKRFLNFTLGNSMANGRLLNPLAGIVLKPGPFQIYLVTDNLATAFAPFFVTNGEENALVSPSKSRAFGFRVGMNLVFGRVKTQSSLQSFVK